MSKVKNTMQLIGESARCINEKYDIKVENIKDIRQSSNDLYDMICNSFYFGYAQGIKASRTEVKGGASA